MSDAYGGLIAPDNGMKFYEGAGIFESVSGMVDSLAGKNYGGAAGNFLATGLGALGAVTDPLQTLFTAGVGWAMEHVAVLREPLDKLMGNPKAIEGHATSWTNIERRLYEAADLFVAEVKSTTAVWAAEAAEAYRRRARDHAEAIQAMGKIADGMSTCTTALGAVVGIARNTIRDIIAQAVGSIASILVQASTGVLIPKALTQVAILVSDTSMKIFGVVKRLLAQIEEIAGSVKLLRQFMTKINKANRTVLRLEAHRLEAADTARHGWSGPVRAAGVLWQGNSRAHGPLSQVLVNTGRSGTESNASQNGGSATDNVRDDEVEPKPVDLPS